MADYSLAAKKRVKSTNGAVNKMRRDGEIPGVYYAKGVEAVAISVKENTFKPLVYTSETHMVNLTIDSETPVRCVVKDVQFHPVTDRIIHFDLQGVSADEPVTLEVPVVLTGKAVGVTEGGVLTHILHKLEVECLPKFVPEHLEVEISNLHLGKSIHVSDLSFENITILNAPEAIIVTVTAPRGEEVASEPVETEVIGKGKSEDKE
ncbi:MAG TPA: 50S ribosomal protein L25 [Melioribacteraceae bacterium]|nr:50S ribosomal protein L25 [Melioribacteraceae bacterium]